MVNYVSVVLITKDLVLLKYVLMEHGVLYVMMAGMTLMLALPVNNLDSHYLVGKYNYTIHVHVHI